MLVGELFDCLQKDEEFARAFWESAGDSFTPAFAEALRSDRQLFGDLLVVAVVSGEAGLSELRSSVDRDCG